LCSTKYSLGEIVVVQGTLGTPQGARVPPTALNIALTALTIYLKFH